MNWCLPGRRLEKITRSKEEIHETNRWLVIGSGCLGSLCDHNNDIETCRAARSNASTGCTDATLTGNYAFNFSGFGTRVANQPKGNEVPIVGVGVFGFDGVGNHSAVQNGAVSTGVTASGTYTLNSDCNGSVTWTAGPFAGVTFNIAVIGGGPEIFGIETDTTAGITATFDARNSKAITAPAALAYA